MFLIPTGRDRSEMLVVIIRAKNLEAERGNDLQLRSARISSNLP